MNQASQVRPESLSLLLSRAFDSVGELLSRHLHLAAVELERDTRGMAMEIALVAGGVPLALTGYLLLCLAAATALAPMVGPAGGLAIVGAFNAALGGAGVSLGLRRLRRRRLLDDTRAQVKASAARLVATFKPVILHEVSNGR